MAFKAAPLRKLSAITHKLTGDRLSLKPTVSKRPKADIRLNASINHVCHFIVYDGLKEVGEALNISSRTVQRRVKEYGLPDCTRTNSKYIINPQNTICLFEELSWLY